MEALAQSAISEQFRRIRAGLAIKERDPLSFWHHAARQTKAATALLREVDELYARGPNVGGKTEWQYAVGLAILQKRRTLDGVPLPQWRGKVEGISLELDYPTQRLSSQQTVLRLLGQWPHHPVRKSDGILSSVRVQPLNGSSDQATWSTLTFMSQENRKSGTGIRADLVLGNEPPREAIWREIRKAAHAGRRSVRIIGATPIIRRQYEWLHKEYGECPRGEIRRNRRRAEVRWSLYDNTALTKDHIETLLEEYTTDPLKEARIHGDYVATEGMCPFHVPTLLAMLDACREPEIVRWDISREVDGEGGRTRVVQRVDVQVLKYAEAGLEYYLDIDPSKGIDSPDHDPGGILVKIMGTGEDVALYEGYIGSYGLGVLAAALARQYNGAMVDFESNSGWSEGVLRGLADSGYGRIAKTRRYLQPGQWEPRLGFETTAQTRPAKIVAIQEWVAAHQAGVPYAPCRFRRVIETLLDTILDEKGKPVAAPGYHDEFMILQGQGLLKTLPRRHDPDLAREVVQRRTPPRERTLEEIMGDEAESSGFAGARFGTPKARPRG